MNATHERYPVILFDVGGTLLDIVRDPFLGAVEAIAHLGSIPAVDAAAEIRRARDQAVAEYRSGYRRPEVEDLSETWVRHYCRALTIAGFQGDVAAAAQTMEDVFLCEGWEVFPDAVHTLMNLREKGYRLGVVSNWPATLGTTLEKAGLRSYFEVIVASGTVGYAKPHPRIFGIAAEHMQVDPGHVLYVGDNIEHDVAGAKGAGMNVILLDRDDRHGPQEMKVGSLTHLTGLLDG